MSRAASTVDYVQLLWCPMPYKRIVSPKVIAYLADTGRVSFMKDTCCDANQVKEKIRAGRAL